DCHAPERCDEVGLVAVLHAAPAGADDELDHRRYVECGIDRRCKRLEASLHPELGTLLHSIQERVVERLDTVSAGIGSAGRYRTQERDCKRKRDCLQYRHVVSPSRFPERTASQELDCERLDRVSGRNEAIRAYVLRTASLSYLQPNCTTRA